MFAALQKLLTEQNIILRLENPERAQHISSGLHLLQAGIYAVQWVILSVLVLVLWSGTKRAEVSGWFLWIGLPLAVFVLFFAERAFREEPSFAALVRYAILTASTCAVPALLGGLALLFEGLSFGTLGLLVSSVVVFAVARGRLEWLATFVPQNTDP